MKLPNRNYKAQQWTNDKFEDVRADILEQNHFTYSASKFKDFEMFIPADFEPNRVSVFKVLKISEAERKELDELQDKFRKAQSVLQQQTKLEILGVGPSEDLLFKFTNNEQGFS